jgi:hypothetical protein
MSGHCIRRTGPICPILITHHFLSRPLIASFIGVCVVASELAVRRPVSPEVP